MRDEISPVSGREKLVNAELNRLSATVKEVGLAASELIGSLEAVLSPSVPQPNKDASDKASLNSVPLSNRIREIGTAAAEIREELMEARRRLEV